MLWGLAILPISLALILSLAIRGLPEAVVGILVFAGLAGVLASLFVTFLFFGLFFFEYDRQRKQP